VHTYANSFPHSLLPSLFFPPSNKRVWAAAASREEGSRLSARRRREGGREGERKGGRDALPLPLESDKDLYS